jgi:Predicted membrane protein
MQWQRWRMVPGLHDVNATFRLSPKGVALRLKQAAPQAWDLQPYFEKPWPVQDFSAELTWQMQKSGWALTANDVQLNTDVVTTNTQFRLSKDATQPLFLALDSQVDLQDASQAHYYFPHGAMGEPVINYLTKALQGGQAKNAKILWHGAFHDFPFKEHNGIFQAWVPLRNATFQFGEGWQPLRQMSLDLLFENDRLDMQGEQALLGEASTPRLHAWFPKLAPGAHLYIDSDIAGTGEAVSDYLYHSPLQKLSRGRITRRPDPKTTDRCA